MSIFNFIQMYFIWKATTILTCYLQTKNCLKFFTVCNATKLFLKIVLADQSQYITNSGDTIT